MGQRRRADGDASAGGRHPRWQAALAEHEREVRAFAAALARVPEPRWHHPPAPGRWTAAELALHVCQAYELGRDALVAGTPGMRLVARPWQAWLGRTLLLPALLAARVFPRDAPAPAEVRPDATEARTLSPAAAAARLERAAREAAEALEAAAARRPVPRFTHAYFGPLPPRQVLRLLSAHTRHHTAGLRTRAALPDDAPTGA